LLIPDTMAKMQGLQENRIKLQKAESEQSAMAHLFGGPDTLGKTKGMIYAPDAAPTGNYQIQDENGNWVTRSLFDKAAKSAPADNSSEADDTDTNPAGTPGVDSRSLFGSTKPQPASLFTDIPQALKDLPTPDQQTQDYKQSQAGYLRQAAPDLFLKSAASQALLGSRMAGLPSGMFSPGQQAALMLGGDKALEKFAESQFPQQPEALRIVKGLEDQLATLPLSDPRRADLQNLLQKTTTAEWQNPLFQQKTLAEIQAALARAQHYGVQDATRTLFKDMPQELQGEDALNWVKQNVQNGNAIASQVANIVAGKVKKPSIGRPGGLGEATNALLGIAYPDFSDIDLGNRFDLAKQLNDQKDTALGGKLNTTEKIINHSIGLLNSALDLDNGTVKAGNYVRNFIKGQTSDAALKAYQLNQGGLGNEFEKLSGGGKPGETSKAEAQAYYDANAGLPGTIGAVGKTLELMEGQVDPVVGNYNRVYGTNYDTEGFIRDVLKQPSVADKLRDMKDIMGRYMKTKRIDQNMLDDIRALKTGRAAAPAAGSSQGGQTSGWSIEKVG
jgi:hypothetical protein